MKDRNILIYFVPAVTLIVSWLVVLAVRQVSLITFEGMSFASGMYLFIFFLSFLFGTLIGPLLWANTTNIDQLNYTTKSINSSANWLLFFSLIAILLLVIKFLSFIGDLSFSLADITEMRLSRGRDPGEEKAG